MGEVLKNKCKDIRPILSDSKDSTLSLLHKSTHALHRYGAFSFSINSQLIQHLGFKDAAYYAKLKATYTNGTIYNYSINKVAKLLGCSHATGTRLVSRFTKEGLVIKNNGNLSFRKLHNIGKFSTFKSSKIRIFDIKKKSIQDLKDLLAIELIKRKVNQQRYSIKKQDSSKGIDARKSENAIAPERLAIGMRKMANFLDISLSSLSALIKRLKAKFGLCLHEVKTCVGKVKGQIYTDALDRYAFKSKKGNLIIHYGSIYSFSKSKDRSCTL